MAAEGPVYEIPGAVDAYIAVFRPVFPVPVPLPLPEQHMSAMGMKHVSVCVIPDVSIDQFGVLFHHSVLLCLFHLIPSSVSITAHSGLLQHAAVPDCPAADY